MNERGKWKLAFAILCLLFNAGTIIWLLVYGKSENSLHVSALSWSYLLSAGVLAGVGFSSIANLIPLMFNKDATK